MCNKVFKIIIISIFVLIPFDVYSQEKFVFIDINYIFNNSIVGKKINKKIKEDTKKINQDLNEFNKKVEKDKKTLLKQKNVISKEEFEKKYIKLENDIKEYRSIIKKKNDKLINLKNQVRIEFTEKLNIILEDYSKNNSISMILKKENIIIGKTSLDASNEVLGLFDKRVKKISIK